MGVVSQFGTAADGARREGKPKTETSIRTYLQRTEWNVRDSDAIVIFSIAPTLSGGSEKTVDFARTLNKPCLHIHPTVTDAPQRLKTFLEDNAIEVLNVSGPRVSKEPWVPQFVIQTLDGVFN